MSKILRGTLGCLLAIAAVGSLQAQTQGRISGTVVDENEQPLADVQITLTTPELGNYQLESTTSKKGRFTLTVLDATKVYTIRLVKEGYQGIEEPIKVAVGDVLRRTFQLKSRAALESEQAQQDFARTARSDRAVQVFNEGAQASSAGDFDTAKAKFEEALGIDARLAPAYSGLAGIHLHQGDYGAALAAADKLLELDPNNVRGLRIRYDAYKAMGDEGKAKQALQALSEVDRGSDLAVRVYNEGAEAARTGDLETARARFQEAVELDPSLAAAHYALAVVYGSQGQHEQALAAIVKTLELEPDHPQAPRARYETLKLLGRQEEAREALKAVATSDPKRAAQEILQRSIEQYNKGEVAEAQAGFEEVLALDPESPVGNYMLGLCLVNRGETAKARELFQRFLALAPDHPDAATAREMLQYMEQ